MAETFVGVSAAIITTRKEDRDILFLAAIDFDETSQVKTLEGAKDVAYWMCAEKAKGGWKLVGIVWTENNEIKLFSGTLLPP